MFKCSHGIKNYVVYIKKKVFIVIIKVVDFSLIH